MLKEKQFINLQKSCEKCEKCNLYKTRNKLVFGKGNINSKLLFIGEAPGEKEDIEGIPFIGRAGKYLDKLLNSINLTINDIYIGNILKCRPPKNRNPNKTEIENCTPNLIKQIEIINPKIIITLGNYATKFVLNNFKTEKMQKIEGISKLHGKIKKIKLKNENEIIIFPIYHPAASFYKPKLKEILETDFKKISKILNY